MDAILSENERKVLNLVRQFAEENKLRLEFIDLANCGFLEKLKFMLRGMKTPIVVFKGKTFENISQKGN